MNHKKSYKMKHILPIIILFYSQLDGQDKNSFNIELVNERNYPMAIGDNGIYSIIIDDKLQSIFSLKGITGSDKRDNITWITKDEFYWSDSIKKELSTIVDPSTFTSDGVGYSTLELLPKMKGMMVVIYGLYYDKVDSVRIFVK